MIPQIWTLQAASGGPEKTLAEWGFTSASLSRANQAVETLTLSFSAADVIAHDDLWAWETEVILRRAGVVFYRGFLAQTPRSVPPTGESVSYVFRNVWWLLERLTYLQSYTAWKGSSTGEEYSGIVRMGGKIRAALTAIHAHSVTRGIVSTLDLTGLDDMDLPPIEGHNLMTAALLRSVLRWHPDALVYARYSAGGTTLVVTDRRNAPGRIIDVTGRPLSDLDVTTHPEQQVDAVRVVYEASAQARTYDSAVDPGSTPEIRSRKKLVIATDVWPPGAPLTRRTMLQTLPAPAPEDPTAPQANWHRQECVTEAYPADGEYDNTAERWWLDRAGLEGLGLTIAAIRLPRSNNATTLTHRVKMSSAVPQVPPSPINPNSTPVWRPDRITDTPRELISGAIAPWMTVRVVDAIAECTIAVLATAVDALTEANKAAFVRMAPRNGTVDVGAGPKQVYLIDGVHQFVATSAQTKVYSKLVSVDYGNVNSTGSATAANGQSYADALDDAIVPDLAKNLYTALKDLPYTGSVQITEEEAGGTAWLGSTLGLRHPARPEWLSMGAQVQSESIDIRSGITSLQFGPAQHLSLSDWAALHASARRAQEARATAANSPQPSGGGNIGPDPGEAGEQSTPGQVIGPAFTPTSTFSTRGGGTASARLWDIEVVSAAESSVTIKLACPGVVRKTDDVDNTSLVTIASVTSEFALSAGDFLALEWTKDGALTLKKIATWTDWPFPFVTAADGEGFLIFEKCYTPLWRARATGDVSPAYPGRHLVASTAITLERLAPDSHLEVASYQTEHPSGKMIDADRLWPGFGGA